jgi:hypothetical protein
VIPLEPGTYRAAAVEFSGLESQWSDALHAPDGATLRVLAEPPKDFSWTRDRWLADSKEVPAEAALRAPQAVREVVHAYDGVICRESCQHGTLAARRDLGLEGRAVRRTSYSNGKLSAREYFNQDGARLSRESFDAEGFIVEQITSAPDGRENDHWLFDRGAPVRQIRKGREYVKQGDRFGFFQDGKFIDTPRGAISQ